MSCQSYRTRDLFRAFHDFCRSHVGTQLYMPSRSAVRMPRPSDAKQQATHRPGDPSPVVTSCRNKFAFRCKLIAVNL